MSYARKILARNIRREVNKQRTRAANKAARASRKKNRTGKENR